MSSGECVCSGPRGAVRRRWQTVRHGKAFWRRIARWDSIATRLQLRRNIECEERSAACAERCAARAAGSVDRRQLGGPGGCARLRVRQGRCACASQQVTHPSFGDAAERLKCATQRVWAPRVQMGTLCQTFAFSDTTAASELHAATRTIMRGPRQAANKQLRGLRPVRVAARQ